ncbi:MarR family transcriptional regulator [Nocardia jinanensis]|uniref:MarR family transcriptional regulator n=1 Tax=Nocardia jinanensis TaxID=382504 RepID=A0A917VJI6_9NOCA|nr:MarR family transcriptional regulator [Nocardia jinanensis]GGK91130.1 MarR family transcriptional regulator [Nocardia jinanensis]
MTEADPGMTRQRRQLITGVKGSLRELRVALALLNHRVGTRVELKDVDLDCLDILGRQGPLSPSGLARLAGLHPATITGILDRLERGGWVVRERAPGDRRAVNVRIVPGRNAEIFRQFAGMNALMDELCDGYTDAELELIADFLRRTSTAGQSATDQLASE